ncbi:hypothetical protein FHG55_27005 [Pseudomonas jessenii]|uniref:Uncharacterized protein n=1 Tax=Pseudomonas jessenii TaxID=77298 RepID=A0A5C4KPY1_PSEJE|nr:hypothetical protein FHG55_27005 [Pseudomonas jessenii]
MNGEASSSRLRICVDLTDAFASKPAPTGECIPNVGAGLLAKLFRLTPCLCRLLAPSVVLASALRPVPGL